MQNFLNLTLPLKQDATSQAKLPAVLTALKSASSRIKDTLKDSQIVHFARFLVIGRPPRYLQVITTFDGDEDTYAKFFFDELRGIFTAAYELVEDAPTGENFTFEKFRDFNKKNQTTEVRQIFHFSAFENKTVKDITGLS